jgi:hypothetical protein
MTALTALIGLVEDAGDKGLPNRHGRLVIVRRADHPALGYGKPPDYDPREDKPAITIKTDHLTKEVCATMLRILRSGVLNTRQEEGCASCVAT